MIYRRLRSLRRNYELQNKISPVTGRKEFLRLHDGHGHTLGLPSFQIMNTKAWAQSWWIVLEYESDNDDCCAFFLESQRAIKHVLLTPCLQCHRLRAGTQTAPFCSRATLLSWTTCLPFTLKSSPATTYKKKNSLVRVARTSATIGRTKSSRTTAPEWLKLGFWMSKPVCSVSKLNGRRSSLTAGQLKERN